MMPRRTPLNWKEADRLIATNTEEVRSDQICRQPLVSVCLITYNHRKFIREAVDSVLAQSTQFPFEVVVGEDCSTDGTTDIVLDYQQRHPEKIRVLLAKENLGKHTGNGRLNFIRTLRACRGKYIALLEGDDYWMDTAKLRLQIDFLQAHLEYVGTFHDTIVARNSEDEMARQRWRDYGDRIEFTLFDTIAVSSPFHTSSFVIRRTCIAELPECLLETQSGDMPLFILAASKGPLRRIPVCMSVYRKHAAGITNRADFLGVSFHIHRIKMLASMHDYLGISGSKQFRTVMEQHWLNVCQSYQRAPLGAERWHLLKLIALHFGVTTSLRLILNSSFKWGDSHVGFMV